MFKGCLRVEVGCAVTLLFAEEVAGFVVVVILALNYREINSRIVDREPACYVFVLCVKVAKSLEIVCGGN